jgi:hypothetical protein
MQLPPDLQAETLSNQLTLEWEKEVDKGALRGVSKGVEDCHTIPALRVGHQG